MVCLFLNLSVRTRVCLYKTRLLKDVRESYQHYNYQLLVDVQFFSDNWKYSPLSGSHVLPV